MLTDSEVAELLSFLTIGTRPDVKDQAIGYLLGLSGNRWEDDINNNKAFEFIVVESDLGFYLIKMLS